MKHISLTPFGPGPATLAQLASVRSHAPCPAVDKWVLFTQVRTARARLGVTDRNLTVLHALLSFLPARELRDGEPLVVFPSNASLSDRAHGMPESTLRRHIAALVAAGLIARRDSSNGKRFAQRTRLGELVQIYGLDLRPLLLCANRVAVAAAEIEEEALALRRRRSQAMVMLRDATKLAAMTREISPETLPDPEPVLHHLRQTLRRRLDGVSLDGVIDLLAGLLSALQTQLEVDELSGSAAQNERHYQNSKLKSHDSESCMRAGELPRHGQSEPEPRRAMELDREEPDIPLVLVTQACPDILPYTPGPLRRWADLVETADRLQPFLGIAGETWSDAKKRMGHKNAAATMAAILQRFGSIRNPGGYLRSLTDRFQKGRFTIEPMIRALLCVPAPS